MESQLEGASALRIRDVIDSNYERIVATIFDALQQMAKMDRDGSTVEDNKDQLNYHVIIIGPSRPAFSSSHSYVLMLWTC